MIGKDNKRIAIVDSSFNHTFCAIIYCFHSFNYCFKNSSMAYHVWVGKI
ncbi:Uncharacterised protein [Mycobacterium tuberculosis]|nr:Uncharacterised protein [Mycobacterium tuberculosis]